MPLANGAVTSRIRPPRRMHLVYVTSVVITGLSFQASAPLHPVLADQTLIIGI
jgi:hypothetical protein